jgi:hypothetical protein
MECPQCYRPIPHKPGTVTYSCTVPGCMKIRFCCPHCMLTHMGEHMGEHVRERDERIKELEAEVAKPCPCEIPF